MGEACEGNHSCNRILVDSYPEPERANDLGEAFAMDVGIMNHSLEGIMEAPVPMKGACAMLFNTAFQRVRPEVQEALESLSSIARALLELRAGERYSHSITSLYEKAGFSLKYHRYNNPHEAIKRVS